ncbi:DUF4185 domain-containing protein [Mycobacterium mantenii]|uniref:Uncharacterized protein n=1 Tax=Mycobacterium mantenii TaxID=560555 RepID=A0A1A2T5Y7_MYCNT|nr:DUF4185 domain-containing protein [Mycobacterium mantenii]OBH43156.1 hypothetical protein A5688_14935 [Mycobacterium mantenii]OBH53287.1 hypothetical protein A5687_07420 [Mycobacterium mantenii]OBH71844.1 hypothetical protein A5682_07445 [Mycobacterium mantenii]OBH79171.1 hypothetical protein A5683_16290 [Mycobacterium mantenii]
MTLTNLNEAELIASAGGDPWAINQSLQAGSPFQVSQLAEAFHGAGRHTAEADHAFEDARKRFAAAWNHQDGGHPINDSEEVRRLTKSLGAQSEQLPKIGAELESIAAALADAQKQGAQEIALLDSELRGLDRLIGAINHDLTLDLPAAEHDKLERLKKAAHVQAVDDVRDAVKQMNSIRNAYADTLRKSMNALHTDGYDPPKAVDMWMESPLRPNEVRNLGPIAGTGGIPGIPGIGAADLGEVVEVPGQPGKYLAIFGDSFSGDKVGEGEHYRSVAVPVTFDADGHPHFGAPLTGPKDSGTELFTMPAEAVKAGISDTLPAGTITLGDKTYMMVTGTTGNLQPAASWLVEVNGDPGKGWTMVPGSYRAAGDAPTQVSGYKGTDGKVYIAANSFDRGQNVTMFRADPGQVMDRSTWQPWTGTGWGAPGGTPVSVSQGQNFGELSLREVGGKPVLSGFNSSTGNVEVRVANDPTQLFTRGVETTVVNHTDTPQPYGGYILPLPNQTLDNLHLFVSQWNTTTPPVGAPYNVQEVIANVNRP